MRFDWAFPDAALVHIWAALHRNLRLSLTAADMVYLRRMLLDIDDDLLARLLAAKLAGAMRFPVEDREAGAVRTGTRVRFAQDGSERMVTLVHGGGDGDALLGTGSRFGAGLFGLRADDAILWPDEAGRLVELHVLDVVPCTRRGQSASGTASGAEPTCVSG